MRTGAPGCASTTMSAKNRSSAESAWLARGISFSSGRATVSEKSDFTASNATKRLKGAVDGVNGSS
jgi:hypothetical protein